MSQNQVTLIREIDTSYSFLINGLVCSNCHIIKGVSFKDAMVTVNTYLGTAEAIARLSGSFQDPVDQDIIYTITDTPDTDFSSGPAANSKIVFIDRLQK